MLTTIGKCLTFMIIKMQEKNDKDILFSKMVKAGKRVYYI